MRKPPPDADFYSLRQGPIVGMPGFHSAKGISARSAMRGAVKTHGSVQKLTHGCGQAAHGFHELRIRLVRDDHYIQEQPFPVEFSMVKM